MQVKIGIRNVARELEFETTMTESQISDLVSRAVSGESKVLTLTDSKGNAHIVPAEAIGYVFVGAEETRRVGFIA